MLEWKENTYGERYLPAYNSGFERMPSAALFKQYVHDLLNIDYSLYVIIGTDSGLLPKYIEQNFSDSLSRFIFIEFSEIVKELRPDYPIPLLQESEEDNKNDKSEFLLASDLPLIQIFEDGFKLEYLANLSCYNEFLLRDSLKLVKCLAIAESDSPDYNELFSNYEEQFINLSSNYCVGATRHYMESWFEDISDLLLPVQQLKEFFKGKTFVLLGGAPSLPLIFDWLKKNRSDVVVLAAVRIASRLKMEGIVPDYFVGVDAKPQMLDYCRDLFYFQDKSVLISSHHLAPNVLNQWGGKVLYMHQRLPFGLPLPDETENVLAVGPTVMNAALQVAAYMGADKIILSGVDMCFSPQGESHESNSIESQIGRYMRYGGCTVETYAGIEAETDVHMLSAAKTLSEQISWIRVNNKSALQVFNINYFATKVDLINYVSVEDLPHIDNKVTDDERLIAWKKAELDSDSHLNLLKNNIVPSVKRFRHRLSKAIKISADTIALIESGLTAENPDLTDNIYLVINNKNKLEKLLGDDLYVLFDYGYHDYLKILEPLENAESLESLIKPLHHYFTAIKQTSSELVTQLNGVLKTSRYRLKEFSEELTYSLVSYWIKNNVPGRCNAWRARHSHKVLTAKTQKHFDKANKAFSQLLLDKVPSFRYAMQDRTNQLVSLWRFTKAAIESKDEERILSLAEYIAKLNGNDFEQLSIYLYAHFHSLKCEFGQSDEFIQRINHERLLIPALQLSVHNAMRTENVEGMLQSIEALSDYDDYYLYILAKLAELLGLDELTGNAFIYYIVRQPGDAAALWDYWIWLKQQHNDEAVTQFLSFLESIDCREKQLINEIYAYKAKS